MCNVGLYVILTNPVVSHEKIAESCVKNGVGMIQLREKEMSDRVLLEKAKNIAGIVCGSHTRFIVNDRVDIPLLSGADGIHVGQEDLSVDDVRKIAGETVSIVGLSTHSLKQVEESAKENVDYIGFGPVFPTYAKKKPDPVVGTAQLSRAVRMSSVPVVAIGGINRDSVDEVLQAGARNIAMIRPVCGTTSYEEEIRFFTEKMREYDTDK